MKIIAKDIQPNFDSQTLIRGVNYFHQNKVTHFRITKQSEQSIFAVAEVSGRNPYQLYEVELVVTKTGNRIKIQTDCTCPVRHQCKHGVASSYALMTELQKSDDPSKGAFTAWLRKLPKTPPAEAKTQKSYVLRLFLDSVGKYSQPSLIGNEVSIFLEGYTLTGRIAKPQKVSFDKLEQDWDYGRLPEAMQAVIPLLLMCKFSRWSNLLAFKGETGFLALSQLIQLNKAYFQQAQEALNWSNDLFDLPLNLEADGKAGRLEVPLTNDQFLVLCEPPILIHIQQNLAQPVNSAVSAKLLEQILAMPSGSLEELSELMEVLEAQQANLPSLSEPRLALPKLPGFEPISVDQAPTGILMMHSHPSMPLFELLFGYGDFVQSGCVQRQEWISAKLDGRKVTLRRHLAEEDALISQLADYLVFDAEGTEREGTCVWRLPNFLHSPEGLEAYLRLQAALPELEKAGWEVRGFEQNHLEELVLDEIAAEESPHSDWFELRFDLNLEGKKQSLVPIMQQLLLHYDSAQALPDEFPVLINETQVVRLPAAQIRPIFEGLLQLYGRDLPNTLKVRPFESHLIAGLSNLPLNWLGDQQMIRLGEKLKAFQGIEAVSPPDGLKADLRPYQQFGLNWLNFLYHYGFNGVLADDMGLGKTLQTLTWLALLKQQGELLNPVLLVVPTSLVGNWKAEAKRFVPELKVLSLHGSERHHQMDKIGDFDLVISTYPLLPRDEAVLSKQDWQVIVLDEAQKIKNPKTKLYASLMNLTSVHRLCLSGTPVENNLGELWSLFNFLMPGFLGNLPQFKERYQKPIEIEGKREVQRALQQRIAPFLLRRTKHQVVTELPDKTEILRTVEFDDAQAKLYETIRLTMEQRVKEAVEQNGLAKSQITILDALLKLRQVCCDPGLVKMDLAKKVKHSAKLALLMDLLEELLEGGHRILIFSQFTSMLKIIEAELKKSKVNYSLLTGQTRKREEAIDAFRSGQANVFLISLKAGGTGLNLTEADTVIHYDPWWNPAVENQATDRAYRIGQDKEVFVYKLVVANSIEEKILQLQAKKQALQDDLYRDKTESGKQAEQAEQAKLSGEDLMNLLQTAF